MNALSSQRFINWDYIGVFLSFLCLIHCLLLPLLVMMLPALSLELFEGELVHKILAVGVSLVSLLAFIPGIRIHKKKILLIVAAFGLLCIQGAVFYAGEAWGEYAEKGLTSIGGLALIAAHIMNRTFCKSCLKCREKDQSACEAPG